MLPFALMLGAASTWSAPEMLPQAESEAAIMRLVLIDARANWKGAPVPCVADVIKLFGRPGASSKRVSQLGVAGKTFPVCLSAGKDRYISISLPAVANGFALVELDYVCPICGQGSMYTLRRAKLGWKIESVQRTWVS